MQDERVIGELKSLLPPHLWPFAYIAGGYAANPQLANDIDLWVLSRDNSDSRQTAEKIEDHLILARAAVSLDRVYADEGPAERFIKVADVARGGMLPIQILVTPETDLPGLFESFDITSHKVAKPLTNPEVAYFGKDFTTANQEPRVTRFDTPWITHQRLEKIAARYGFTPNPEDVAKLLRAKGEDDWSVAA